MCDHVLGASLDSSADLPALRLIGGRCAQCGAHHRDRRDFLRDMALSTTEVRTPGGGVRRLQRFPTVFSRADFQNRFLPTPEGPELRISP